MGRGLDKKVQQGIPARLFAPGQWKSALFVFAVALLLRSIVLMLGYQQRTSDQFDELAPDSRNCLSAAHAIAAGELLEQRNDLLYFPPGYPLLIAGATSAGGGILLVQIVQLILSAASAAIIVLIAGLLGLPRIPQLLAGLFCAAMVTSIALVPYILSDTVYTACLLLSLLTMLRAIHTDEIRHYFWSGVWSGLALLIRPAGLMWPMLFAGSILIRRVWNGIHTGGSWRTYIATGWRLIVMGSVVLLLTVPWVLRNFAVHDLPILSLTTISAPATVAAKAYGDRSGTDYRSVQSVWERAYLDTAPAQDFVLNGLARNAQENSVRVWARYPWDCLRAYGGWAWDNITAPDELIAPLHPMLAHAADAIRRATDAFRWPILRLIMAIGGLVLLWQQGKRQSALIIALALGYCIGTIGWFPYQGSRYFLPGLFMMSIPIAVVVVRVSEMLRRLTGRGRS